MTLSRERLVLLVLALIGIGFLVQQTRQPPVQLSFWRGGTLTTQSAAQQSLRAAFVPQRATERPSGNPLRNPRTVITQGYGVGSHAPASVWGGIDLAIDSNGDGKADPQGTWYAPVYATHDGIARVRPNTWPGGNYLAIENFHYKTAYAHLNSYAVVDGQPVVRGQLIGYVGSTGKSSGPHLHYEVWERGVNRNPLSFEALHHDW
ncbi:MAG: M23 family metallopeptidase [Roseiflexaceae bacterium]|nr:M23 family metallopeptidase [Roseiflexaceae bacterium]